MDRLIKDIIAEIEKHASKGAEVETGKEGEISSSGERIAKLKELILELHKGVPFNMVLEK